MPLAFLQRLSYAFLRDHSRQAFKEIPGVTVCIAFVVCRLSSDYSPSAALITPCPASPTHDSSYVQSHASLHLENAMVLDVCVVADANGRTIVCQGVT